MLEQLVQELDVAAVHTNEDYEPYATKRDAAVAQDAGKARRGFFRLQGPGHLRQG